MTADDGSRAGAPPRRILFLSHSHAFGVFRVGSHHYARVLSQRGDEVVHLSTPVSAAHRLAGRMDASSVRSVPTGVHRDEDGIRHLVPRTLLPRPYGRFRVADALARHGCPLRYDAVLLDQPLLWDGSVRGLSDVLVYRPTDLYPSGIKARLQHCILRQADGVVATSAEVRRALGAVDVPTLVLENGVEAERFAGAPAEAQRPPVCVYVGALDTRFDWDQIGAWAQSTPDADFVIAGPSAGPAPRLPSNVRLLGPVAYDQLPALLGEARVGLLPLSDDPLNDGRSPMKLHEYLAAGLTVVTRATPVLLPAPKHGVFAYRDRSQAADALRAALAAPSPNAPGRRHAASMSWSTKTTQLDDFLKTIGA